MFDVRVKFFFVSLTVHVSLENFVQIVAVVIETFHHVHHYVVRRQREKDKSVPNLPEERNPVFFFYPVCMLMSFVFCVLWLLTNVCTKRPEIVSNFNLSTSFI